ncbi:hypothetical protein Taro_013815 [Colocasia esculenta]|uniref:Uncharacterized protein n=1 Tax=Colocasia esculenta TaxID=4460 RepID=A0A843UGK1_COLES|nr:hypothetical protein [Colocasia esculenta]
MERGRRRAVASLRVLREVDTMSRRLNEHENRVEIMFRVVCMETLEMVPRLGFSLEKATNPAIVTR